MVLISVLILFITTLLAGWIPLYQHKKNQKIDLFISFSSGCLISMAFIHMLPMSIEKLGEQTGLFTLVGFLFVYLLEKFVMVHPCQEQDCHAHHIGLSAFVGLSVHCLIAGISVGIAMEASVEFSTAFPILLAFAFHKIPESFILASLLSKSKFNLKQKYLILFVFSLVAPLGLVISDISLDFILRSGLNVLLAVATGTFVYIASSDLLPQIHSEDKNRWLHLVCFLAGVGFILLL